MATPMRNIRVSDEEWATWVEAADAKGDSVSGFIRSTMQAAVNALPVFDPNPPKATKGKKQAKPTTEVAAPAPTPTPASTPPVSNRYAAPPLSFGEAKANPRPFTPLSKKDQSERSKRKG